MKKHFLNSGDQKLFLFRDKLEKWQAEETFVPVVIEWHPSRQCQHRCPDCIGKYAVPMKRLRREQAGEGAFSNLEHIREVLKDPPNGIVVSGNVGEPLLHPEIDEIFTILEESKVPCILITNGEAFTPELAARAMNIFRGIRISVDAHDKATFLKTHGRAADGFVKVLENIELLAQIKKEQKSSTQFGIGYLTRANNLAGMVPATRLAKALGADYIQFRPFFYDFDPIDKEFQLCKQLEEEGFRVMASLQKYAIKDFDRSYYTCQGAYFYTLLDATGTFYMCCHHVGRRDAALGSLRNVTWNEFLKSQLRKKKIASFCVSNCIPHCRLHTHNNTLKSLVGELPTVDLAEEVRKHGVFL